MTFARSASFLQSDVAGDVGIVHELRRRLTPRGVDAA
jgi:hypothetical protein